MRTAIISDIHGNLEAFNTVLKDIDENAIDSIICLGDLVGYGSQPEEIVQKVRELEIPCVLGNHDLAIYDDDELKHFEANAAQSINLTRELLSPESIDFLKKLPTTIEKLNILYVHGSPKNSVTKYIFEWENEDLIQILKSLHQNIIFVGHTHLLLKYEFNKYELTIDYLDKGKTSLKKDKKYLFNIGSIGQPRDGTPHAKYAIFDDDNYSIEIRFVVYDILKTVSMISKSDFHNLNGARLIRGK